MSFSEMLFLTVLALIVFGPKKLSHVAKQVGRMLNELKSMTSAFRSQLEIEVATDKERETAPASLRQQPLPAETNPGVLGNDTSRDRRRRVEAFHG